MVADRDHAAVAVDRVAHRVDTGAAVDMIGAVPDADGSLPASPMTRSSPAPAMRMSSPVPPGQSVGAGVTDDVVAEGRSGDVLDPD